MRLRRLFAGGVKKVCSLRNGLIYAVRHVIEFMGDRGKTGLFHG